MEKADLVRPDWCKTLSTHHSAGVVVQSPDDHHEGAEQEGEEGEADGGQQEDIGLSHLLQEIVEAAGQAQGG